MENPVKPKKIPSNQKQNPAAPATPSVVASGAEDQLTPLTPPPGAEDPIAPLTPPGAEDAIAAPAPKKAAPKKAAAPKAAAPKAEAAPEKAAAVKKEKGPKLNDLKIIEGVGPKIETLLKEGGISTWAELAAASEDRIKEILDAAGPRYQVHDPSTWPAQSKFAAEGKWEELKEYQDMLTGGRDKSE
ncbi:MAG: helix-hairpin-helix domain-containing protein [Saprospiraceae bacterium]